jgi:hypothetical protein
MYLFSTIVDADKEMHAFRKGRSQLVLFADVDVAVIVQRIVEGRPFPVPFIRRAANGAPTRMIRIGRQTLGTTIRPTRPVKIEAPGRSAITSATRSVQTCEGKRKALPTISSHTNR